jgi:hypothetical protein
MGPAKRAPKSPLAERKSSAANGLNGRKNPAAPNALVLLPPLFSGQKFFRNGPGALGTQSGQINLLSPILLCST